MTDFAGAIIEIAEKHAVVMTDNCNFVMIKSKPEMFTGQKIVFRKSDLYPLKKSYLKYFALAASVFFLVAAYAVLPQIFTPNSVFAYVDVDINPSVEFAIDKKTIVLDCKPLNQDGQILLQNLNLVDLTLEQAIVEVVNRSKQQGYLKIEQNNPVLVAAAINTGANNQGNGNDEKDLDNILANIERAKYRLGDQIVNQVVFKVTAEERDAALENDISMGRYSLYQQIRQNGMAITVNDARTASVFKMLNQAQMAEEYQYLKDSTNSDDQADIDQDSSEEINGSPQEAVKRPSSVNVNEQNAEQDKNTDKSTKAGIEENSQSDPYEADENSHLDSGDDDPSHLREEDDPDEVENSDSESDISADDHPEDIEIDHELDDTSDDDELDDTPDDNELDEPEDNSVNVDDLDKSVDDSADDIDLDEPVDD